MFHVHGVLFYFLRTNKWAIAMFCLVIHTWLSINIRCFFFWKRIVLSDRGIMGYGAQAIIWMALLIWIYGHRKSIWIGIEMHSKILSKLYPKDFKWQCLIWLRVRDLGSRNFRTVLDLHTTLSNYKIHCALNF